jgi:hypothetical protein
VWGRFLAADDAIYRMISPRPKVRHGQPLGGADMITLAVRVLAAIFISFFAWSTYAYADKRVALVVGNAQCAHTSALPNPRNDAQDIADLLKKIGFDVTVGYDLNQASFARVIDEFARTLEGADVGLFFYAGHGVQINEKNYLVSTEAKLENAFLVPSETIELDVIVRLMDS